MRIPVISQSQFDDPFHFARGREIFIRLSLLTLMGVSCVIILRPFLNLILCGIVISIGIYPAHRMLTKALHGRAKLSATICSIALLLVVILPCVLLAGTLVDGVQTVIQQVQTGRLDIPAPPASLEKVPVVGPRVAELWNLCSTNLSEALRRFAPQMKGGISAMVSTSARVGGAIVQLMVAILLAGFLLATSESSRMFAAKVFARVFGDLGDEFMELVGSTVKTVTNGVLGVAVIQTLFASLGFWVAGLPAVGLWALLFLVAAVLQVGTLVMLPAVLYGFAAFSTTKAVIFLVWCAVVGLMDNVLKPILLGRGAKVPMIVIFLGVLGGFIALNSLIGLFVGAIVLSVAYKLFMAWLDSGVPTAEAAEEAQPVR
ncbi:MAG TPA: AI-2E family transporter [Terracidiphilus sp.]|nr:AI-2E family transporter [Terracidiphilus sp.]